jgi:hypothetical protein
MNLNNIKVSERKQRELLNKAEDVIDTVSTVGFFRKLQ